MWAAKGCSGVWNQWRLEPVAAGTSGPCRQLWIVNSLNYPPSIESGSNLIVPLAVNNEILNASANSETLT